MKLLAKLILAFAVVFVSAAWGADSPLKAPDWTLKDVDGHDVSFDQFRGKVVIVDFWATWCVPCRHEVPGYVALQEKYRADGLVVIGISVDRQGPPAVKKFMAAYKVNYLMVMADDDVAEKFGGMSNFPTTFLIDRDGLIRDRKEGVVDQAEYERRVLKYLKP